MRETVTIQFDALLHETDAAYKLQIDQAGPASLGVQVEGRGREAPLFSVFPPQALLLLSRYRRAGGVAKTSD